MTRVTRHPLLVSNADSRGTHTTARKAIRGVFALACLAACLGQTCGTPYPGGQDGQVAGFHPDSPSTGPNGGGGTIDPAGTTLNADAGLDVTVNEGDTVTLDGSASTGGSGTSYSWTQQSGTSLTWETIGEKAIRFTAPQVDVDTEIQFVLTLTNGSNSVSDSVKVLVRSTTPVIPDMTGVTLAVSATVEEGEAPLQVAYAAATLGGQALPEGGKYTWTFGDNSTAEGKEVTHGFSKPGVYLVSMCLFFGPTFTTQVGCADRTAVVRFPAPTLNVAPASNGASATVTMACESQPATDYQIRYTLDGSTPSTDSSLYLGSIMLTESKTVTARVFAKSASADTRTASAPASQAVALTQPAGGGGGGTPATPGSLAIAEPDALASAGSLGGPFSPAGRTYALSNPGESAIQWSASASQSWLSVSPASGILDPGGVITTQVTVSIKTSAANSLSAGSYNASVTFTNETNGRGTATRSAYLTINPVAPAATAPVIVDVPDHAVTAGVAYSRTPTLSQGTAPVTWSLVTGPAGMSISPSTGVVSWSTPTVGTHAVEIIAANSVGSDNESWTLTVNAAPGALSVSPAGGLSSSGSEGGPFNPVSQAYTLTNTGGQSINWTASSSQAWVTLSASGGTLIAGASTTVTVSINAGANALSAGSHSDSVAITNTTNGSGNATRPVSVTVYAAGALPMTTASRTTGVAPLAVFFDAVDTASPAWSSGVVQPPPTQVEKSVNSQPINITGAVVAWVSGGAAVGNGTLSFTKVTNTFTWSAPGDSAGAGVAFTADAQKVLTSANGTCIGLKVTFSQLPAADASDTIAIGQQLTPDYASYHYVWDFGDPTSGTWSTDGRSKNTATGYIAAHVFELPGTYTVTLRVIDTADREYVYTQDITVLAAPAGGWTTYYVSSSTGNDANAGTDPNAPLSSFATAMSKVGTNRRILFKRGDSWTVSSGKVLNVAGPGIVGSYFGSDGADDSAQPKPVLNAAADISLFTLHPSGPEWRLMNLRLHGPGGSAQQPCLFAGGTAPQHDTLVLNTDIDAFHSGVVFPGGDLSTSGHYANFFVGGTIAGIGTTGLGGNGLFVDLGRSAVLGVTVDNNASEHCLRVWHSGKSLVAHNTLTRPGGGRHALKFHHLLHADGGVSRYNIISDNRIKGEAISAWYGPVNSSRDERLGDAVIERNTFECVPTTGYHLIVSGVNVTIRNNLTRLDDGSAYQVPIEVMRRGLEPAPDRVRLLNNTMYCRTAVAHFAMVWLIGTLSNVTVANNCGYWDYPSGSQLQGLLYVNGMTDLSFLASSNNLWYGPSGKFAWVTNPTTSYTLAQWQAAGKDSGSMFAQPLLVDPGSGDFRLQRESPARAAGESTPYVREDFLGTLRSQMPSIGAFE